MDVAFTVQVTSWRAKSSITQYFGLQVCASLCSKSHGILEWQFQGTAPSVAFEAWMDKSNAKVPPKTTFSNHTFHNSHPPPLPRFTANSSHPEHWCLTGKLDRSKSDYFRLLLQLPAKIKVAAFYCFMIHLQQVIIWSSHIKGVIWLLSSSDTELISSCPISASNSSTLLSSLMLLKHTKNYEVLQPPWEGSCTKDHRKSCFLNSRRTTAVFWKQEF